MQRLKNRRNRLGSLKMADIHYNFRKRGNIMRKLVGNLKEKAYDIKNKVLALVTDNKGQGTVDTAIIILISVVLGALVLAGLYMLMDDTVLPTLTQKIQEMFNYSN